MICNLCCACAFHEVETSERRLHYTDRRALIFGGQYPERGAQVLHQCIGDQAHWNARPLRLITTLPHTSSCIIDTITPSAQVISP